MLIVEADTCILHITEAPLRLIERAGRTCYKSTSDYTQSSAERFAEKILKLEHESVLEHAAISVLFTCDRGVSHELVRHRLASFSQESTRFCNYSRQSFGEQITVIRPCFFPEESPQFQAWRTCCELAEEAYFYLLNSGARPEEARSVLPSSLKTEIVMTANLREWRHVFELRCSKKAHPQMRQLTVPLLKQLRDIVPVVFDDIHPELFAN
jgi:thymidylate synthase (FAD)